ncbi:DUF2304 domain-containing protein [Patescibacteria group bacterium]|nr:DUF2304 domain-containing protein [Patescibacteria group bacterium]
MTLIQIILLLLVLLAIRRLYIRFSNRDIGKGEFSAWLLLWLAALLVIALPQTASYLALWVGVGRGSDLVVYLAVLILFYLVFKMVVRLEKIEQQLTIIVRSLAKPKTSAKETEEVDG